MTVHVACAVEGRRYAAHAAAMLHSLLARNRDLDVAVHLMLAPDVPARHEHAVAAMVEREGGRIESIRVPDERVAGLPVRGFTRKATWYRIFLPELLADLPRVLYLDSDLIVVDSLAALWDAPLGDHYLAAVTNVFESWHVDRPAAIGLPGPEAYFNAGVLLMNLEQMRREDCTERLLREGRERHELEWRDQDVLNAVLWSRRLPLHPRWNCMNSTVVFPWSAEVYGAEAVEEARRNPAVRHFEGQESNKPWHYLCDREMRELYLEHRRHTPWPRVRREGVTPANVVRRLAASVRRSGPRVS